MVKIHINRHIVAANRRDGVSNPPISVVRGGSRVERCREVEIVGPARLVYRPERPLKCGATVWIEAADALIVSDPALVPVPESEGCPLSPVLED